MPHIELLTNADAKTTRPTLVARSQATEIFNRVIGPHVPPGREVQMDISSNLDTGTTKVHFFANYAAPELYELSKIAAELACIKQQSWADSPLMLLVRHRAQSAHEQIELAAEIQRLKP